jgi:hypothetical protein
MDAGDIHASAAAPKNSEADDSKTDQTRTAPQLLGRYETLYKKNKAKADEEMKAYKNSEAGKSASTEGRVVRKISASDVAAHRPTGTVETPLLYGQMRKHTHGSEAGQTAHSQAAPRRVSGSGPLLYGQIYRTCPKCNISVTANNQARHGCARDKKTAACPTCELTFHASHFENHICENDGAHGRLSSRGPFC